VLTLIIEQSVRRRTKQRLLKKDKKRVVNMGILQAAPRLSSNEYGESIVTFYAKKSSLTKYFVSKKNHRTSHHHHHNLVI